MLLTLTARSLARRLASEGPDRLRLEDVPKFTLEQTGLRGVLLDTIQLKGWSVDRIDALRVHADQAGCPCLLVRESYLVPASTRDVAAQESAIARLELVARAAHRLGCNAFSVTPERIEDKPQLEAAAMFLRRLMERVDRLELNVLVEPSGGLLAQPASLVELVKKVGGFRVGTMPSFDYALATGECYNALRQTAPYAGALLANCGHGEPPVSAPARSAVTSAAKGSTVGSAGAKSKADGKSGARKSKATEQRRETARATAGQESPVPSAKPGAGGDGSHAAAAAAWPTPRKAPSRGEIAECIGALINVGYEQIVGIDYLGEGDPLPTVIAVRKEIETLLAAAV